MKKENLSLWLVLAFAIGIIFFFQVKGVQFYLVPSESMEPTLMKSDYICGFRVKPSELRRGDIVVFTGNFEDDFYVKRIVGLPGDTLHILDGVVYVNGLELNEPYVANRSNDSLAPVRIPDGHIFVMGDNRTNSTDSRNLGPISEALVQSKVSFIYSPISRMGGVE